MDSHLSLTDLYSFPKDILVKLVATIQDNTEKRYESQIASLKIDKEIVDILKKQLRTHVFKCNDTKCGNFLVILSTSICAKNGPNLLICIKCSKIAYCMNHYIPEMTMVSTYEGICNDCFKKHNLLIRTE
jgi:hypothetical protein